MIIGTAGHVDHGKTALVRALTGMDCDTHPQEKARGLTINPGFAHVLGANGNSLSFVDLPGHNKFITNMISGSMAVDFILLVIAADDGIMPQTREHLSICSLLGIRSGAVVLNKSDLVDAHRLEVLDLELKDFTKGSFLENAHIFHTSSVSLLGVEALKDFLFSVSKEAIVKSVHSFFRLNVDRAFVVNGLGVVLAGTAHGARLKNNDELFYYPSSKKIRIKSIQRHGEVCDSTEDGTRVALNVSGIKNEDLCSEAFLSSCEIEPTNITDVSLTFISEPNDRFLKSSVRVEVIIGNYKLDAQLRILFSLDSKYYAQIKFNKNIYLLRADKFIIRDISTNITLAGGEILDACPLVHKNKTALLLEDFKRLDSDISDYVYIKSLRMPQCCGLDFFSKKLFLPKNDFIALISKDSRFIIASNNIIPSAFYEEYFFFLKSAYSLYLSSHSFEQWDLDRNSLLALVQPKFKPLTQENDKLIRQMQEQLFSTGALMCISGICVVPEVKWGLPYGQYVFTPLPEQMPVFYVFVHFGLLLQIQKYFFEINFVGQMRAKIKDFLASNYSNDSIEKEGITLPVFKEISGLSRKQSLALLEQFDAEGWLLRVNDVRVLR